MSATEAEPAPVTPDLRAWLDCQEAAGLSQVAIYNAMCGLPREDRRRMGLASDPDPRRWFVLQTRFRAELVAAEELKLRQITAHVPCEKRYRRSRHARSTKREAVKHPLIPRYLFVRIDDDTAFARIREVGCVEGLLGLQSTGRPLEIPALDVKRFMVAEAAGLFDHTGKPKPTLGKDDPVRITRGPFTGYKAKFMSMHGADRVRVLMQALLRGGREWPTVLDLDQVEKVANQ